MLKIAQLLLIAASTLALVFMLIHYLPITSFSFAVSINFLLMGCTFLFTEKLNSPLNLSYFEQKSWEKSGKIYRLLGINLYRKLLVWTGWEKLNKANKPVKKHSEILSNLFYRTKQDELGHIIVFAVTLVVTLFVIHDYNFLSARHLLLLNILLNIYPILLQRYNRPRIARVISIGDFRKRNISK